MGLSFLIALLFIFIGFISLGCFINARHADFKDNPEMPTIAAFTAAMTLIFFLSAAIILYKIFS